MSLTLSYIDELDDLPQLASPAVKGEGVAVSFSVTNSLDNSTHWYQVLVKTTINHSEIDNRYVLIPIIDLSVIREIIISVLNRIDPDVDSEWPAELAKYFHWEYDVLTEGNRFNAH